MLSPIVANTPQAVQMRRQGPTAPEYSNTDLGEMKIPEPIIVPTIREMPLIKPICSNTEGKKSQSLRGFFQQFSLNT